MADSQQNKAQKKSPAKKAAGTKAPAKNEAAKKAPPKTLRGRETITEARRLGGWDFATWRMATDDPVMRSTILSVMLLESSPDWDRLCERYERATRLAPVLRSKVVEGPLDLQTPRMVVDPNFDLSWHMIRVSMHEGATWEDVLDYARRQSMTDFDKERPLWRVTVLEGLPGGKSAVLQKLHHAIIDGQGMVQLGRTLFDSAPEDADLGPMPEAPDPVVLDTKGFLQAVVRNNVGWVARTVEDVISGIGPVALAAIKNPKETIGKVVGTAESILKFTKTPMAPLSPIMQGRSINYHFHTIDIDFATFRAAAKKRGRTVNDLYLAAICVGLNRYHEKMGSPVGELRMSMPISLRTAKDEGKADQGNAVSVARFEIPVDAAIDDLLEAAASTVRRWRDEPALKLADYMAELSRFLPPDLVSAAAQTSDVTASNVPGPPETVWLAGARALRWYPLIGTIGAAVNVSMLTYDGVASVGVSSDDAAVTDRGELIAGLRYGFAEVIGADLLPSDPLSGK